jgi:hypothetical protein
LNEPNETPTVVQTNQSNQKGCDPGNKNESPGVSVLMPIEAVGVNLIEAAGCVPSDSDD